VYEIWTTVVGNVVTDPEYRYTEGGVPVVKFRMASTPSWRGEGGWVDGETSFISVRAFRSLADNTASSIYKGQPVLAHGKLKVSEYVNREGRSVHDTQLEAQAIGHNLARGTSAFRRLKAGSAPAAVPPAWLDPKIEAAGQAGELGERRVGVGVLAAGEGGDGSAAEAAFEEPAAADAADAA
jgi:single-strand DNA-binding protein